MMLHKQNAKARNYRKYFALIPILAVAFLINACTTEDMDNLTKQDQTESTFDKSSNTKVEGTDIYKEVEDMPQYPGGNQEMMAFLGNNIVYPESCKAEKVEGMVVLGFVIDREGRVTDIKPIKSPDDRLTANAVEVVGKMPAWIPGKVDGEAVKVQYNLPIKYQLR